MRLLPRLDLLDTFDAARTSDDALDSEAMRVTRAGALEQRDAAMSDLFSSYSTCRHTLDRFGPNAADAKQVVRRFAECAQAWEACERRIAALLKGQLREGPIRARVSIDDYLERQESLAWEYWRDLVQFWTSFVEDQRTVP